MCAYVLSHRILYTEASLCIHTVYGVVELCCVELLCVCICTIA